MVLDALNEFCGSLVWDEQLLWNSTQPDVTPCFQTTVLTWVPCAFLWILAPLECYFLKRSHYRTLPWTGTNIARMLIAFVLAVLCLTNIIDIIINQTSEIMYAASLTSSSLKALTFLFSIILMLVNRKRGRHTSGILFIFWFILTACEIIQYRSAFIQIQTEVRQPDDTSFITHMIYFPLLIAALILSCIADVKQRHIPVLLAKDTREESPEMSASFLSILTFWWFNGMSYLGWKRPLVMDDLWDLNQIDKTAYIAEKFEKYCRHSGWAHATTQTSVREGSSFIQSDGKGISETEVIIVNGHQDTPKKSINIVKSLVKTFWSTFVLGSICC